MWPVIWLAWLACSMVAFAQEVDNEESRKVLGSSVVTSVSVIMDHGNGTKTYITDAAGHPVDQTEGAVGSPVDLLNPDRYEFYTFDETGDLVKKLMTLDQIKGLLAGGDGETLDNPSNSPTFYHESLSTSHIDDSDLEPNMAQGVHNVVASVQNVLRSELEASKTKVNTSKPPLSIPDSISSWSMLFPAIIDDSSETLDDGNNSGNSVNDPIDFGDRLPASSNEEKTEVKIAPEVTSTRVPDNTVTAKPTAVPPIIHFLEIQSVPSPLKNPTKTPGNVTTSTTPVVTAASTTEPPTVTNKPTSPVSPIQEMSASLSSLLSQVTDNQTSAEMMNSAAENKISDISSVPPPTTEMANVSSTKISSEKTPTVMKPPLKTESSNVNAVTKIPSESVVKTDSPSSITTSENKPTNAAESSTVSTNKDSKPNLATTSTTTAGNESSVVINKTADPIVSFITTTKPVSSNVLSSIKNNTPKLPSTATPSAVKQKIQSTTPVPPSIIKKNNVKNQAPTSTIATTQSSAASNKIPTKPATTVNNTEEGNETLEAHASVEIYKVIPNKQSQTMLVSNKTKNDGQKKPNVSNDIPTTKPSTKPHKKVPSKKPQIIEESHNCTQSKKTPSSNDSINKEKLEVAASSNLNDRVNPSKLKTPTLQEVKIVQKPTTFQSAKPVASKIKPSDNVKITTYKPSTSQPFTTKQSTNKISTTTERPLSENKITSASKVHEVNSSLFDIKEHVADFQSLKIESQSKPKVPTVNAVQNTLNVSNYEGAASNTDETKVPAAMKTNESLDSSIEKNLTIVIDHESEVKCTHSKKPIHTSIQDKISDLSHDVAASNSEEIKLTTDSLEPTTEFTTDASSSADATTELITDTPTKLSTDDLLTTTEQPMERTTDLPETTTLNMPEMDFVKEGISAVTNILLDLKPALEPQLPLPTIPLSESASSIVLSPPVEGEMKHASSFDDLEMTTADLSEENITGAASSTLEKELLIEFTTTDPPMTETMQTTTENITGAASPTSEKELLIYFTTTEPSMTETVPQTTENIVSVNTSVSSNSSEESTEQVTEPETTPLMEETTTELYEKTEHKEFSESKIVSTIISNQTLPTKESKLSPEDINETAEATVLCNHTLAQMNTTKDSPVNLGLDKNTTEVKEQLESAQSLISAVNKTSEENITTTTTPTITTTTTTPVVPEETTPKNTLKDESYNLDFKTAAKPNPPKYTQVKYPTVQNVYRPVQEAPINPPSAVELHPAPHESMGLEATTAFLADDVRRFSDLCNELAFRMWTSITGKGSISSRSLVMSPFATTSLLAMVFLGARGPTSGQMNDVLRLDDMVTFNPHQVLQNVTESVLNSRNYGVTTAAFVRELYSDKLKGKILDFYKERAQQYYDGHVEEISFNGVGDILRRRTNLLVKRQTLGKVPEYLRGSNLNLRPPLAAFSANIFQTDCDLASTEGRDGEMYFVVRPSTRQRRLVPVPAAVWRTGFLAGYEPGLDATAVALGTDSVVSTILVLPGQQGQVAPGDGLARLEQRLIETSYRRGGWTRLLRSLLPRPGLELQVPRYSHRSVLNITSTLQRMGLKDLFNENRADLRGLNGLSNDLHLSDVVQVNTFSTCGDDTIGARHHTENYPISPQRMGRDDPELYPRPEDFEDPELFKIPLNLRPRQARLPDNPRLRFDRPFLYMVRHNPTGMILHMGRFNPRLLP